MGGAMRADEVGELDRTHLVLAADDRQHRSRVGDDHDALREHGLVETGELGELGDRLDAGGVERLRASGILAEHRLAGDRRRDLEVGGVRVAARHDVLADGRRSHELVRAGAAHHPDVALDHVPAQAAAVEDPGVRGAVGLVAGVEPRGVAVERVRVLHDELAHAQHAALRTRLVAHLRLKVVPALRQVAVGADLARRVPGDDLLVRHRKHHAAAGAILEAKLLRQPVAAGLLPDLGRVEHRHEDLLRADAVHLLADDRVDALDDPQARAEGSCRGPTRAAGRGRRAPSACG